MTIPVNSFQWFPAHFRVGAAPGPPPVRVPPAAPADKAPVEPVTSDLSPLTFYLHQQGLDPATSGISVSQTTMEFDLHYSAKSTERLTARGYYSEKTQTLEVNFSFSFQQEVTGETGTEIKTYEGELTLILEQVERQSLSTHVEREDIMTFLRRLLSEIAELVGDDEQSLGSVVLRSEDFMEMVNLGDGRLVTKLMALIQMAVTQAQMKRLLDGGGELAVLAPIRKEESVAVIYNYLEQIRQFSLTMHEVTSQTSPAVVESTAPMTGFVANAARTEVQSADQATMGA